ncbi:aldose epimerase family protein [Roseobacter sp. CCS2]|uniref:aldose epimerase family protein n=1 Tax=Roseobacter sp. CCS2 TaxID=391593 RepID=UPI0000F4007A|nr:aldose epimerase family protein [Roseobacter sp. CCS2]EBA13180.1 putative aldose 1-epimerase protein [Roseobacter sp. CCS2]
MAHFGKTQNGTNVEKITISAGGLRVSILTFGAIVQDVRLAGVAHGLALGSDRLQDYEDTMGYFGAIVGPIANRISNARVRLDGMMYELERNENGKVHLHSGTEGVHRRVWQVVSQTADSVTLALTLADGDAGLPGHRDVHVTYAVSAPAIFTMTINGTTNATTCMNFASHIYWNLDGTSLWEGHQLQIAAEHYLPVDDRTCPTGEIARVAETDMDFRKARQLQIGAPDLDHNFCLTGGKCGLRDVLWLTGQSGLKMALGTTEAGMQIHDAATSPRPGHSCYEGLVIEPQAWPDTPNHRAFGSITVTADQPYKQVTTWRFSR